ncbi:hypothetical protein DCS_08022 [Drechmeria coniospora]|uniref:Uncharacterized protein n=1 Tax=Drechmeria coniospora TaxID=98403 RepID=A0A151GG67_DRECN|nr:hypothetical protein DCS_08022 [Drechmeria coniospora]KYK56056.1 hypothetical protein DCS_08022 [Drechmeria coniospora]ODA76530.1 hypothetical protein RJ55_07800 [Drechmeria coniospora]
MASNSCIRPSLQRLLGASRSFSTSQPSPVQHTPPQAPSYIRLPTPPQSSETKPQRVRGHLPVPRQIFSQPEGDRKVRPEYIKRTAPKPSTQREPSNEAQRWKAEVAHNRRVNLEEGLQALWIRRRRRDSIRNATVGRKFEEHHKAAAADERQDDRLTRSTVLGSILDTKTYPDPDRFSRVDRSRTKVMAKESTRREARRDAIMELYISASNFIVQESELEAEIDKIFTEDYFRKQSQAINRYGATENTWGIYGKPPSIANMLETTTGTSTKLMDYYESEYDRSVKRQKRIAEDLTGGKME